MGIVQLMLTSKCPDNWILRQEQEVLGRLHSNMCHAAYFPPSQLGKLGASPTVISELAQRPRGAARHYQL